MLECHISTFNSQLTDLLKFVNGANHRLYFVRKKNSYLKLSKVKTTGWFSVLFPRNNQPKLKSNKNTKFNAKSNKKHLT